MNRGAALYLAIVLMGVILALVLGVATLVVVQLQLIRGIGDSVVALYAADAGAEWLLQEDKDGVDIVATCTVAIPCTGTLANGSSYEVFAEEDGIGDCPSSAIVYCVDSTGFFSDATRNVFLER